MLAKTKMKILSITLTLCISCLLQITTLASEDWYTSIAEAVEEGKKTDKPVFVKFTGSDWCQPCQDINKKVFSKEEFLGAAKEKFILCIIDSPRGDKELAEANKPLTEEYKIIGFPAVLLLNSEGTEFTRFNPGVYDTVEKMLEHMNLQLRRKDMF